MSYKHLKQEKKQKKNILINNNKKIDKKKFTMKKVKIGNFTKKEIENSLNEIRMSYSLGNLNKYHYEHFMMTILKH